MDTLCAFVNIFNSVLQSCYKGESFTSSFEFACVRLIPKIFQKPISNRFDSITTENHPSNTEHEEFQPYFLKTRTHCTHCACFYWQWNRLRSSENRLYTKQCACLFQSMFSVYVFVRMCVRACALVQLEARYYSLVSSKKIKKETEWLVLIYISIATGVAVWQPRTRLRCGNGSPVTTLSTRCPLPGQYTIPLSNVIFNVTTDDRNRQ